MINDWLINVCRINSHITESVSVVLYPTICIPLLFLGTGPCMPSPCLNGASCFPTPGTVAGFFCLCNSGFSGLNCETGNRFLWLSILKICRFCIPCQRQKEHRVWSMITLTHKHLTHQVQLECMNFRWCMCHLSSTCLLWLGVYKPCDGLG